MKFKVALISSQDHCDYILNIVKDMDLEYTISCETYMSIKEIPQIFSNIQDKYDAFCTTGAFSKQLILKTHPENTKPIVCISESVEEFYKVLLSLLHENRNIDFSRIVFDHSLWLPELRLLTALDYVSGKVSFDDKRRNEIIDTISLEQLIEADDIIASKATDLWKENKIDLVICRHSSGYISLKNKGIPCIFAYPTSNNITDTLIHLSDEIALMQMNDNLPAVIYLNCPELLGTVQEDITTKNIELQKALLDFDQEYTTGFLVKKATNGIELYTTKRTLQRITYNFTQCTLKKYILGKLGLKLLIGYGIGVDVMSARIHAIDSFNLFSKNSQSYVIDNTEKLLGPLEITSNTSESKIEKKLQLVSQSSGLSVLTLHRILSAIDLLGKAEITTQELATVLQVTVANANRFMNQLVASGHAKVIGEKKALVRGRPTRIYNIEI